MRTEEAEALESLTGQAHSVRPPRDHWIRMDWILM